MSGRGPAVIHPTEDRELEPCGCSEHHEFNAVDDSEGVLAETPKIDKAVSAQRLRLAPAGGIEPPA